VPYEPCWPEPDLTTTTTKRQFIVFWVQPNPIPQSWLFRHREGAVVVKDRVVCACLCGIVCVSVWKRVCVCACACACACEREYSVCLWNRERESVCVCMCLFVNERQCVSPYLCVCVCVWERERERDKVWNFVCLYNLPQLSSRLPSVLH